MELRLYLPQYNELLFREQLLSDPETMRFNRFKEESPGYDPKTGCIEFPRRDWALWYEFWMNREPENFYAVVADGRTPIGEVSWFFDGMDYKVGIILLAKYRRKGYAVPTLRLLVDRAFEHESIPALSVTLSTANTAAVKAFTAAGFRRTRKGGGICDFTLTRREWSASQQSNE